MFNSSNTQVVRRNTPQTFVVFIKQKIKFRFFTTKQNFYWNLFEFCGEFDTWKGLHNEMGSIKNITIETLRIHNNIPCYHGNIEVNSVLLSPWTEFKSVHYEDQKASCSKIKSVVITKMLNSRKFRMEDTHLEVLWHKVKLRFSTEYSNLPWGCLCLAQKLV